MMARKMAEERNFKSLEEARKAYSSDSEEVGGLIGRRYGGSGCEGLKWMVYASKEYWDWVDAKDFMKAR